MPNLIEEFKRLIINHKFFEAHELFEEIWFPIRKSDNDIKHVYRGFINSAVSFELYKRGRVPQSQKVWDNSQRMLKSIDQKFTHYHLFIELQEFLILFRKEYSHTTL
jgi:hypothetical protein